MDGTGEGAAGVSLLARLLGAEGVTEVLVDGPERVQVRRAGGRESVAERFADEAELKATAGALVALVGRRLDADSPYATVYLTEPPWNGAHLTAALAGLTGGGTSLALTRFHGEPVGLDWLVGHESLTSESADYLRGAVGDGRSVAVAGGLGSGKTTVLNALAGCIPAELRVVSVEEGPTLLFQRPGVVRLFSRPAGPGGRGEVTARELVNLAPRLGAEALVLGECRGGEALALLRLAGCVHGWLTSLFANSVAECLSRLEVMVMMAGCDLPLAAIRRLVADNTDVILQHQLLRDGRRRATAIVEVEGADESGYRLKTVFGDPG
ncbi:MAG: CpaF family protein [Armatimonadetes bacterium]|nr:CpaF family protein [Armatimonadota bacterium]